MFPEGSVNTTTLVLTALHTRNAVTEGAHVGREAHFTRPSPTVHAKEYRSVRVALLWQYSQFGSGVALHKARQRKRGASEPLRVFVNELKDLARQA